jgi:pimeloyl-ACP methyl ester carboxylesterase
VVLQHGWPEHWWEWRHLIPALAERYRVICPDLRGFGWSDAPQNGDYLKETLADDLIALLGELGVERTRYVGHDWGCWLGFLLGLRPDPVVERMVLLSALPPWPGRISPRRLVRMSYQLPIVAPLPNRVKRRYFDKVFDRARGDGSYTREEKDVFLRVLDPKRSARLYRTLQRRELLPVIRGRYAGRRLTVPTLFMIGDRDLLYDDEVPELVRANADRVEVEVVRGAGHFLPEERPEHIRDRVLQFLA